MTAQTASLIRTIWQGEATIKLARDLNGTVVRKSSKYLKNRRKNYSRNNCYAAYATRWLTYLLDYSSFFFNLSSESILSENNLFPSAIGDIDRFIKCVG